jgi:hypothetical protein
VKYFVSYGPGKVRQHLITVALMEPIKNPVAGLPGLLADYFQLPKGLLICAKLPLPPPQRSP